MIWNISFRTVGCWTNGLLLYVFLALQISMNGGCYFCFVPWIPSGNKKIKYCIHTACMECIMENFKLEFQNLIQRWFWLMIPLCTSDKYYQTSLNLLCCSKFLVLLILWHMLAAWTPSVVTLIHSMKNHVTKIR